MKLLFVTFTRAKLALVCLYMNTADKICKEVVDLFSFIKEQTVKSVVLENTSERTALTEKDLERVVNVLNASFDTAFQRSFTSFQKQTSRLVESESESIKKKK